MSALYERAIALQQARGIPFAEALDLATASSDDMIDGGDPTEAELYADRDRLNRVAMRVMELRGCEYMTALNWLEDGFAYSAGHGRDADELRLGKMLQRHPEDISLSQFRDILDTPTVTLSLSDAIPEGTELDEAGYITLSIDEAAGRLTDDVDLERDWLRVLRAGHYASGRPEDRERFEADRKGYLEQQRDLAATLEAQAELDRLKLERCAEGDRALAASERKAAAVADRKIVLREIAERMNRL